DRAVQRGTAVRARRGAFRHRTAALVAEHRSTVMAGTVRCWPMTVRTEVDRSPEQFADDLAEFARVDWPAVWAGYGNRPELWTARLDWRLTSLGPEDNMPFVR